MTETDGTDRLVLTAAVEDSHSLADFFKRLAAINGVKWDDIWLTHSVWLHSAGEPKNNGRPVNPAWFRSRFDGVPDLAWVGLDPLDPETLTHGRLTYRPYEGMEVLLVPHPQGWWVLRVTLRRNDSDEALMGRHIKVVDAFLSSVRTDTVTLQDEEPLFEGGLRGFARTEARYVPRVGPYQGLIPQLTTQLRELIAPHLQ
jgi:hypothetical protein